MKITHKLLLAIFILNFSFIFSNCSLYSTTEISTSSPDNLYRVRMVQQQEEDASYLVKFNVQKQDKMLIEDRLFHRDSGEFINSGLKTKWLSNNVLSLYYLDSVENPDQITVENQTDKVIRYLKVTASDRFLLLELQPHSKTKLLTYPQTADLSWVGGVGKFDDEQEIPAFGMNFRIRGKYVSPAHYCILVKEKGILIQSKDFEGFLDSGNVPEVKNLSCE